MRVVLAGAAAAACFIVAGSALAQETQTYTYDVHGRLASVKRTAGSTTRTTTYALDNADNRTSRLLGAPTSSAAMAAPADSDSISSDVPVEPGEAQPLADNADASSEAAADPVADGPTA